MKSAKQIVNSNLKSIESEVYKFNSVCDQSEFNERDLDQIYCQIYKQFWLYRVKKIGKIVAAWLIISIALVNLVRYTSLENSLTAIARTAMIKILPYWNWKILFGEQCLLGNPLYGDISLTENDCMSCESIRSVDIIDNISYDSLVNDYLTRDAPVIITDAMDKWPVMNSETFSFNNITELYLYDERLSDTLPCVLSTNIRYRSSDLTSLLHLLETTHTDKWFIHWQNCDIAAVKALRKFLLRPYFLSSSISPSHLNWVLISSDYSTNKYKMIDLSAGLIIISQLKGKTSFKLAPIFPCNDPCLQLQGDLHQGEMLVFTSFLWSLEYHPTPKLENIAIVTETIWENRSY